MDGPRETDAAEATSEAARRASVAELSRVADELLPALVARLGVSGLGELEVRHAGWHVRLRRADSGRPVRQVSAPAGGTGPGSLAAATPTDDGPHDPVATSPGVGYVSFRSGLAVGHRVTRGDALGWVEVLGVRQEIVAPADGVVGELIAAPGDPVEFGQSLVRLLASEASVPARVAE